MLTAIGLCVQDALFLSLVIFLFSTFPTVYIGFASLEAVHTGILYIAKSRKLESNLHKNIYIFKTTVRVSGSALVL